MPLFFQEQYALNLFLAYCKAIENYDPVKDALKIQKVRLMADRQLKAHEKVSCTRV